MFWGSKPLTWRAGIMQAAPAQDMIGVTPPRQPRSRRPRRSPTSGQRRPHNSRRSTSTAHHEHTPDRASRRSRRNSAASHTPSHTPSHTSPVPLSTLLQPTQEQDQEAASTFPQQLQVAHARLVALQAGQQPTDPVSFLHDQFFGLDWCQMALSVMSCMRPPKHLLTKTGSGKHHAV